MKFLRKLFSCGGRKSARADIYQIEPKLHTACRSTDPKNLKSYQVSRNKAKAGDKNENKKSNDDDELYRPYISDNNVPWDSQWPDYAPIEFTSDKILKGTAYSDPNDPKEITKWNDIDNKIDRRSFTETYQIIDDLPHNVIGRTGIKGRGHLGRWGPNHAGDPIVTRWKKEGKGKVFKRDGKPVLQFVAIERKDTKEWAIPGGMVDPGERITSTLKREFMEEATNSTVLKPEEKAKIEESLKKLFSNGEEVYKGYVDDPRNTDNAWMETTAYNFHDESGIFDTVKLDAGDDAGKVKWLDIDKTLKLYASHKDFIETTAKRHKAFW